MRIEGERGRPLTEARLVQTATGKEVALPPKGSVRCDRCGGPVYLDAWEDIPAYRFTDEPEDPPRRGRPPRPFTNNAAGHDSQAANAGTKNVLSGVS